MLNTEGTVFPNTERPRLMNDISFFSKTERNACHKNWELYLLLSTRFSGANKLNKIWATCLAVNVTNGAKTLRQKYQEKTHELKKSKSDLK